MCFRGSLPKFHSYGILFSDKGDEEEEYAVNAASERGWRVKIPAEGSGRSLRSFRAEACGAFCVIACVGAGAAAALCF